MLVDDVAAAYESGWKHHRGTSTMPSAPANTLTQ
jgi:hypothetical protein